MRHWLTKLLEVDPLTALVQAWEGLLAYLKADGRVGAFAAEAIDGG
jgi:hypothetical protein